LAFKTEASNSGRHKGSNGKDDTGMPVDSPQSFLDQKLIPCHHRVSE